MKRRAPSSEEKPAAPRSQKDKMQVGALLRVDIGPLHCSPLYRVVELRRRSFYHQADETVVKLDLFEPLFLLDYPIPLKWKIHCWDLSQLAPNGQTETYWSPSNHVCFIKPDGRNHFVSNTKIKLHVYDNEEIEFWMLFTVAPALCAAMPWLSATVVRQVLLPYLSPNDFQHDLPR